MNKLLSLGVFGTFGKPYGFQQYFYFDGVFNQTLDLNTNAIGIFPETELFSVKREIYNGLHTICISKYTYANEINSSRGGTFIGSCILLTEAYTDAENIYLLLNELHNDLISSKKNIIDSVLQVQQATQLEVKEPLHFENVKAKLNFLKETDCYSTSINPNNRFLIEPNLTHDSESQVVNFIDYAIKYFTDFDTLYFTYDKNVHSYVNQKGLLKTIKWETFTAKKEEVIKLREEKKRIEEEKKRELEKKKQNPNNSKDGAFTNWVYRNEKKWDKNQIKKAISEYNRLLDYCLELDSQKFSAPRQIIYKQPKSERYSSDYEYESTQYDYRLIASLAANLILVLFIIVYFFFFNEPRIQYVYKDTSSQSEEIIPEKNEERKSESKGDSEKNEYNALNPKPNSELNFNDKKVVSRSGLRDKTISEITKIIFSKNPTDIESHYKEQKEAYSKALVELNRECFTEIDETYKCTCDSLSHIPSFKIDK